MTQISRKDRIDAILNAAMEIVYERGANALTMQEVGDRIGISRQSLYGYYRSTGEILNALFERMYQQLVVDPFPDHIDYESILDGLHKRISLLFHIPAPVVRVVASAFNGDSFPEQLAIRTKLLERVELNWIQPIMRSGLERDVATSGVYAVIGAALLFRDLIDRGMIDIPLADVQLRRIAKDLLRPMDVVDLLTQELSLTT